ALARFLALNELYYSGHALDFINIRLYYDPLAARLEPIGFDACPLGPAEGNILVSLERPWSADSLADPDLARAYVQELVRMSSPQYLQELRNKLGAKLGTVVATLNREWWDRSDAQVWDKLAGRQEFLRRLLAIDQLVTGAVWPAGSNQSPQAETEMTAEVANTTRLPVELLGWKVGDQLVPPAGEGDAVLLAGQDWHEPVTYKRFNLKLPAGTEKVSAVCRLVGKTETHEVPLRIFRFPLPGQGPRPQAPTIAQVLQLHPFLKQGKESDSLEVRQGNWLVNGDLVLPESVSITIGADRTLRFEPGALFLSTGSVNIKGKPGKPVRLVADGENWAGLIVIDASESAWENAIVTGTMGVDRKGWTATGGVTFYRSNISLTDCQFEGSFAEDTINVVRADVRCRGCRFSRCRSDAFDGDFATGGFVDCVFDGIGGDGIDISGSDVQVTGTTFCDIADKAISAGEYSRCHAEKIVVVGAGVGLASKDLSRIQVTDLKLRNTKIGLAAYMKKAEYGPGNIEANAVVMDNVGTPTLVQTDSIVKIDGIQAESHPVNVDELYAKAKTDG
ncbi:MAG: hypothetical protein HQ546_04630, partial [Planctomycetes bacterium]|nr:hypothetical protein [Planctomycetota bacterium]